MKKISLPYIIFPEKFFITFSQDCVLTQINAFNMFRMTIRIKKKVQKFENSMAKMQEFVLGMIRVTFRSGDLSCRPIGGQG